MLLLNVKQERFKYHLAWALMTLLLFITVFGTYLMPHGIGIENRLQGEWQVIDGVKKMVLPPYAPGGAYPLGTDHRGYDVLSLLLNGAKYTLGYALLVTLLRFLIALPLGLFTGVTGRGRGMLSTLQLMTAAVPPLLFIFPTLYGLNGLLTSNQSALILFAMLVVIGIFQVAHQFSERARFYNEKLYIHASRTMGATNLRVAARHLIPHLRPEMLFAFLTEYVQVLFLLGQLAVVKIFLGGFEDFQIDEKLVIQLTKNGEWGAMVSYGSQYIREYPWIVAAAGLFFTGSVLILSFFSKQVQQRLSMPFLYTRRPFWKNRPAQALIGTVAIAAVAVFAIPQFSAPAELPPPAKPVVAEPSQPATPSLEDRKENMLSKSNMFMGYLAENKLEYANYLVDGNQYTEGTAPLPAVFADWARLFSEQGYKFVKIGEDVRQSESVTDFFDQPAFELDVFVTDPGGAEAKWLLLVTGSGGILDGK